MGDGNHSFATAKANWERIKKEKGLTGQDEHPARYALVELETSTTRASSSSPSTG